MDVPPDIDVVNIPVRELIEILKRKEVTLTKTMKAQVRDRFVSMSTEERREHYGCGEDFIIFEQIPSWQYTGQTDNKGASNVLFEPDDLLNSKVALWHGDIGRMELDVYASVDFVTEDGNGLYIMPAWEFAADAGYFIPAKYLYFIPKYKGGREAEHRYYGRQFKKALDSMKDNGYRTLAFDPMDYMHQNISDRDPNLMNSQVQVQTWAMETTREWLRENHTHVDKIVFCALTDEWYERLKKMMHTVFPVNPTAVPKYYFQGSAGFDGSYGNHGYNAYNRYRHKNYNYNSQYPQYANYHLGQEVSPMAWMANQNSASDSSQNLGISNELEKQKKQKEELKTWKNEFERLIILVVPFFILPETTARFFAATELFSVYLEKMGVKGAWNLIIMLTIQGVDLKALSRGRFQIAKGGMGNMLNEIYSQGVGHLGVSDQYRLLTAMLIPQSGPPQYID